MGLRVRERIACDTSDREVPVETEAGTEVVVSRVRIHRARLTLHPDGIGVVGINRVDTGDLELGIGRPAAMLEVKKLIWKTVMKRDPPVVFCVVLLSHLFLHHVVLHRVFLHHAFLHR